MHCHRNSRLRQIRSDHRAVAHGVDPEQRRLDADMARDLVTLVTFQCNGQVAKSFFELLEQLNVETKDITDKAGTERCRFLANLAAIPV